MTTLPNPDKRDHCPRIGRGVLNQHGIGDTYDILLRRRERITLKTDRDSKAIKLVIGDDSSDWDVIYIDSEWSPRIKNTRGDDLYIRVSSTGGVKASFHYLID